MFFLGDVHPDLTFQYKSGGGSKCTTLDLKVFLVKIVSGDNFLYVKLMNENHNTPAPFTLVDKVKFLCEGSQGESIPSLFSIT